jgi:RNA polymerase sigma factor (sigma-70 family)
VIQQACEHDEEALVALYHRALPVVYRYVLARLGRPDLTEDVVSEVFVTMIEAIGDLRTREEAGFYAWLLQIAQGKMARTVRQLARSHQQVSWPGGEQARGGSAHEPLATDLASDPVGLQEWRETLQEVGQALGRLSAEQQVVVVGRFLGGQNIEDLAHALGKQPGAVRVLQFRALQTLARYLGRERGTSRMGKGGGA